VATPPVLLQRMLGEIVVTDYGEELDDVIDEAREIIAASNAATEDEYARIREFQHNQKVSWVYPQRDWLSQPDFYEDSRG